MSMARCRLRVNACGCALVWSQAEPVWTTHADAHMFSGPCAGSQCQVAMQNCCGQPASGASCRPM